MDRRLLYRLLPGVTVFSREGPMAEDSRSRWFASIIQAGLDEHMFGPDEVLLHVTPDVMAHHLPPAVLSAVLESSLAAGAMTPDRVIETLNAELLAQHIPHDVLWKCVADAAVRAGLTKVGGGA
jgi:hypothetical protein